MNSLLIFIILIPIIEIYLFIHIGTIIGAISTIFLIFVTAIIGIYYAKYEGLNTLRSGFNQISKNKTPTYEVLSGAAIALGAILLIVPGFLTDSLGFLIIFPITRKIIFYKIIKRFKKENNNNNDYVDGEFEEIEEKDDRKI